MVTVTEVGPTRLINSYSPAVSVRDDRIVGQFTGRSGDLFTADRTNLTNSVTALLQATETTVSRDGKRF